MWNENQASTWAAQGNSPQAERAGPALPGQQAVTALPHWLPCSGFPEQRNSLCATGWTRSLSCPGSLPQALTSLLLIQALISQRSLVSQSFGWPSGVPPAGINGTGWGSLGFGRGGLSPTAGLQSWEMSSDHATQVMWGAGHGELRQLGGSWVLRGPAGLRLREQGKSKLVEMVLQTPQDACWGWEGSCIQGRQAGTGRTCGGRARGVMTRDGGAPGRKVEAQGLPWAEHQQCKHNPNKQVRIRKELICRKGSRNCASALKWE